MPTSASFTTSIGPLPKPGALPSATSRSETRSQGKTVSSIWPSAKLRPVAFCTASASCLR